MRSSSTPLGRLPEDSGARAQAPFQPVSVAGHYATKAPSANSSQRCEMGLYFRPVNLLHTKKMNYGVKFKTHSTRQRNAGFL